MILVKYLFQILCISRQDKTVNESNSARVLIDCKPKIIFGRARVIISKTIKRAREARRTKTNTTSLHFMLREARPAVKFFG